MITNSNIDEMVKAVINSLSKYEFKHRLSVQIKGNLKAYIILIENDFGKGEITIIADHAFPLFNITFTHRLDVVTETRELILGRTLNCLNIMRQGSGCFALDDKGIHFMATHAGKRMFSYLSEFISLVEFYLCVILEYLGILALDNYYKDANAREIADKFMFEHMSEKAWDNVGHMRDTIKAVEGII